MAVKKKTTAKKPATKKKCAEGEETFCKKTTVKSGVKKAAKKTVTISFEAPSAYSVSVAGDFNGWARDALTKNKTGLWQKQLKLNPGRYQYRFIVDEVWCDDPDARQYVMNEFGSQNAVLFVG